MSMSWLVFIAICRVKQCDVVVVGGGDRKPWWQLYLPLLSLLSKQFLKKEQKSYKLKRHNRTNEQTQFQFGQTME